MPVFHDFDSNGEPLGSRDEILNKSNLLRYKKEFGDERFNGYMDCLHDMLTHFDKNFVDKTGFRQNFCDFWQDREDFHKQSTLENLNQI